MAPAKGDWEGLALGLADGLALGVGDAEGDTEAVFPPVVWVREAVLEELLVRLELVELPLEGRLVVLLVL